MPETARPSRAEEVRTERRRKPGALEHTGYKLGVDEAQLDRNTYKYRWVNDKDNRVQKLTGEDWDIAPEMAAEASDGLGTPQSKVVGKDGGKPFHGVLMRKRKDWFEADQAARNQEIDAVEESIRRGDNHTKESPELAGGKGYTPNGRNQVSR